MSTDAVRGAPGGAAWAAKYKYECVVGDSREIDIQEQKRRGEAHGRGMEKATRVQSSAKAAASWQYSLFGLLLL